MTKRDTGIDRAVKIFRMVLSSFIDDTMYLTKLMLLSITKVNYRVYKYKRIKTFKMLAITGRSANYDTGI